MNILYIDSGWEKDYLLKYILGTVRAENYYVIQHYQLSDRFLNDLLRNTKDFILVFSSNTLSFNVVKQIAQLLKPKVIIHNSDEYGQRPEFLRLSEYTDLFLTQYAFYHKFTLPCNTMFLPLPFLPGVHEHGIPSWNDIKPPSEREYDWSFVGTLMYKPDRVVAIDTFKSKWPNSKHYTQTDGKASRSKTATFYKNSKFIISPRGNRTVLCTRVFEAITCGSIPVLSGCTKEEVETTFDFEMNDDSPITIPFLYANTWDEAVELCKNLQNVEKVQTNCIKWYRRINENIIARIKKIV
jgi:hypothetical protein